MGKKKGKSKKNGKSVSKPMNDDDDEQIELDRSQVQLMNQIRKTALHKTSSKRKRSRENVQEDEPEVEDEDEDRVVEDAKSVSSSCEEH